MKALKRILLIGGLSLLTVSLSACSISLIENPYNILMKLGGPGFASFLYVVTSPQTETVDQSTATSYKAEVTTRANFEQKKGANGSSIAFAKGTSKKAPSLQRGSYVLKLNYQIDLTTGAGSGSGVGIFKFKGKRGGQWCVNYSATISNFGEQIDGEFNTVGGIGRVGRYSVGNGKITAGVAVNTDNKLTMTLSGKAKQIKKPKKMPGSCKSLT